MPKLELSGEGRANGEAWNSELTLRGREPLASDTSAAAEGSGFITWTPAKRIPVSLEDAWFYGSQGKRKQLQGIGTATASGSGELAE